MNSVPVDDWTIERAIIGENEEIGLLRGRPFRPPPVYLSMSYAVGDEELLFAPAALQEVRGDEQHHLAATVYRSDDVVNDRRSDQEVPLCHAEPQ